MQKLITPVFSLADFLVQGQDKYDYYKGVTCAYVNNPGLQSFCDLDPNTRFFAIKKLAVPVKKPSQEQFFDRHGQIFYKIIFPKARVKLKFDCKNLCTFLRYKI